MAKSILSPSDSWRRWIQLIASDHEKMDLDRLLRHIREHITDHIPNVDANPHRWAQWLTGTYNLLGILSEMVECNPTFELGVSRLFNKWRQHPFDFTPPPKGQIRLFRSLAEKGKELSKRKYERRSDER